MVTSSSRDEAWRSGVQVKASVLLGQLGELGGWPQDVGVLRQLVVELAWCWELGHGSLDHHVAQDVLVDAHLGVELAKGLGAQGKVELPDVGLRGVVWGEDAGSRGSGTKDCEQGYVCMCEGGGPHWQQLLPAAAAAA